MSALALEETATHETMALSSPGPLCCYATPRKSRRSRLAASYQQQVCLGQFDRMSREHFNMGHFTVALAPPFPPTGQRKVRRESEEKRSSGSTNRPRPIHSELFTPHPSETSHKRCHSHLQAWCDSIAE